MGFSEGATVAASFIAEQEATFAGASCKGAFFFCAGTPAKASSDGEGFVSYNATEDGQVIQLPTAHILGQNDKQFEEGSELKRLCNEKVRWEYVHNGGHDIPHGKAEVRQMVEIITKVIDIRLPCESAG